MAIYHFSAKVITRAAGSSAVAAAAYRSASRLHDARIERTHDFSNKAGVVHSEVMLPDGAPEAWRDRERLWNDVEAAEVRKDAQLAREVEFAIPRELNQADGIALAREFVAREFVSRGMVADLNVHWDVGADGEPKPHAHVMLGLREVTEDGFGPKVRDWNRTELLTHWREAWAEHVNQRLAELDIDARVDHRSLEAQGIELEPQHKIGPAASRMAEQGLASERLHEHHAIARANGEKILAKPEIALEAITHQQSTFTTRDLAMFVHRHSEGKDQFDAVLAAVRTSPELVKLSQDGRGEDRFTSRAMIETEQRLEKATIRLEARRHHGVAERHLDRALARAQTRGMVLSPEQCGALEHVTEGRGLGNVIGYAGTGKSAMLGIAREAWESAGYEVRGAALSGIAAENLESGSGIASRTIASLEHQWAQDRERLTSKTVLVIDEAGMIGTRQMERVMSEAEQRGAKVVLVGDPQQLQAIEAGAAFRSIAERHGSVEITQVRRQHEEWQRDATRQLATGRTAEALEAYRDAGMITESLTRQAAREALIERWDAERAADPHASRMILSHTNQECDELNALARDRLKARGMLVTDIAVKTTRGERLFAAQDRIMFLRNERSLGVKNGTLGTIETITAARMEVRLDDGRSVAFDHKDYTDLNHGYAATIHKSQGVTVDRTHVLATPGLDRHGAYVALSRHRTGLDLHYGKDDFADRDKLARVLARDRSKDMASDHDRHTERFAEARGIDGGVGEYPEPKAHEHRPARAPEIVPQPVHTEAAKPRGRFEGLRLRVPSFGAPVQSRPTPGRDTPLPAAPQPQVNLGQTVQRYARAVADIDRMKVQNLPALEYQKKAQVLAAQALEAIVPGALRDLTSAFAREPALVSEAANGRTATTIRAMQLEAEVRTNPELRADRFVQGWQQLRAQRDALRGWDKESARAQVEGRMKAMAKGVEKDPAMGAALARRGNQLLGKHWSPEWVPGSQDGGMGRDPDNMKRAKAMGDELIRSVDRGRNLGMER